VNNVLVIDAVASTTSLHANFRHVQQFTAAGCARVTTVNLEILAATDDVLFKGNVIEVIDYPACVGLQLGTVTPIATVTGWQIFSDKSSIIIGMNFRQFPFGETFLDIRGPGDEIYGYEITALTPTRIDLIIGPPYEGPMKLGTYCVSAVNFQDCWEQGA
jgi:hypothetical protein